MKQRKPAREQRQIRIEHITGQVQKMKPKEVAAKIREPDTLRQQDAHSAHTDEERALQPHGRHREDERGIAEP
jgi:hypothetical protein